MRVVVTGGTGNVGSRVVERLSRDDAVTSIVGIARRRPGWQPPKTTWLERDLATDDLTDAVADADAVVHLAWLFQPTRNPEITWRANAVGSARLLRAMADAGVPVLVHASSIGAYSPRSSDARSDERVDESWPTHGGAGTASYSREKAYVERLLDTFELRHPDCRVVRMRPAFIFQEAAASQQRRLFAGPLLPGALVRRGMVPVLPDPGGLTLQAVHTDDVAEAYRLALLEPVTGAFNLAAEPVLDMPRIAECLGARVVRVPPGAVRVGLAAAWAAHLVPASPGLFDLARQAPLMDTTRATGELGWTPSYSSVDALSALLAGLRSGSGGPTPPLDAQSSGPARWREFASGIGRKP
ncbi:MAG: NAD-dependent epimerase/dehydratase family protein [Actinomycetota bacterium]|nr:NAD-dependent epimerase/dehydratase family protein [Actinomycetota bacterium]